MRKLHLIGLFALILAPAATRAEEKPVTTQMAMQAPKPGEETKKLEPIAADMKWEGKTLAGALGEGSPEMPSKGTMNCDWTVDHMFLLCDINGMIGADKKTAMKWKAKFTLGYDHRAKEYRATMIDNMGSTTMLTGTLEGNRITLTSDDDIEINGKDMKSRLIMDWTDPKAIQLIGEHSIDDKAFTQTQAVTLKPGKKHPLPANRAS